MHYYHGLCMSRSFEGKRMAKIRAVQGLVECLGRVERYKLECGERSIGLVLLSCSILKLIA